jgi:regulatory protein
MMFGNTISNKSEKVTSDLKTITQKACNYCAYQERCSSDVVQKLKLWGISDDRILSVLAQLQKEGFVDDARFARNFVRGKFANNHWGRIKISMELKMRKISASVISEALQEIDENDYEQKVLGLLQKKSKEIKDKDVNIRKQKLLRFLISKGFETGVVLKILSGINAKFL